ncbi:MAG: hypothetical protein E7057_09975 [Lentisphaerae bacterium]|nr:hypothetical protein [Lentisphaerota bacterium]
MPQGTKTAGGTKNRRQAAVSRRVVPGRGPSVFVKASPGQGGGTLVAEGESAARHRKAAVRRQYRAGSYPVAVRRNTAGGKSAARHKKAVKSKG